MRGPSKPWPSDTGGLEVVPVCVCVCMCVFMCLCMSVWLRACAYLCVREGIRVRGPSKPKPSGTGGPGAAPVCENVFICV